MPAALTTQHTIAPTIRIVHSDENCTSTIRIDDLLDPVDNVLMYVCIEASKCDS